MKDLDYQHLSEDDSVVQQKNSITEAERNFENIEFEFESITKY